MKPTDVIHESWKEILPLHFLPDIQKKIKGKYNPDSIDIFKAFGHNLYDSKALLLGGMPFKTLKSNGLLFGCNELTNELRCICRALHKSYHVIAAEQFLDWTMIDWQSKGLIMLHSSLTTPVRGNHIKIWEEFIKQTLINLLEVHPIPIWFIGSYAQSFIPYCQESELILKSPHPGETEHLLSMNGYDESKIPLHSNFIETSNFKELDNYLTKLNGESFKWFINEFYES